MQERIQGTQLKDEIDLIDLFRCIGEQRWLVLAVLVLALVVASGYAFLSRPIYEARGYVIPPTQNGIADFNYGRTKESGLEPFSVKDVYEVFLRNLQGESLRREFFENQYLTSLTEAQRSEPQSLLYQRFSREVTVLPADKAASDRYVVVVRNSDPVKAAEWTKLYIERAGQQATSEMVRNATREAEVRARNISQQISNMRESGQKVREDLIVRLREALRVAKSIGLENPPIISGDLTAEVSAKMDGELAYMRGSKALLAEIENLEQRRSDDPFIERLRELQTSYSFYSGLDVSPENVSVYRVDGVVELPDEPVKPKKLLIVGAATVLGAGLGLVLAVGWGLYSRGRKRTA
ncbi:Wzz/FepE/Etk N-terminal domain-containing protein [Pseudomonas wadenswilerensis]|uniref:LPS O-antigen chain length determinant protein WzzB n=1 Tax=Pseudomonas wadenswilerensis TaxID=1785161 RepID=UPI00320935ED